MTHSINVDSPPVLIPTKLESLFPNFDFSNSYRLIRLFGLTPDQKSFLFKMIHNLLPTKERLYRLKKVPTPYCIFCPDLMVDDMEHFFVCSKYFHIMGPVTNLIHTILPGVPVSEIVSLRVRLENSNELPFVWLLSSFLMLVWNARIMGKALTFPSFQAEVQACSEVLKATRWNQYSLQNSAVILDQLLRNHLHNDQSL